jgi:ATP adenylyltransferase
MERLWAPWRLSYITQPKDKPTTGDECFICRAVAGATAEEDRTNLVVHRTELSVVMLNLYPYNNGHLLVMPRAHKARLDELTTDELLDTQLTIRKLIGVVEKRMKPDGFNVGLNLGRAAGAGVPGHMHWHIVPRWSGDSNFMTTVGDIRVLSQSLEALYDLLTAELATEKTRSATDEHR